MLWKEITPGFSFISRWGSTVSLYVLVSVYADDDHSDDEDFLVLIWLITEASGMRIETDYRMPKARVWTMDETPLMGHTTRKFRVA